MIAETLSRGRAEWSLRRVRRSVEAGTPNAPGRSAWIEHRRRALTGALVAPADRRRQARTAWAFLAAAVAGVIAGVYITPAIGSLAALVAATGSLAALTRSRTEPGTVAWWRDRTIACWETAAALGPLEALGWTVLHDRAVPGTDTVVDHLLIGPSGIWALSSERTYGSLRKVDGRWWYTRSFGHLVEEVGSQAAALAGRHVADTQGPEALLATHLDLLLRGLAP